MTSTSAVSVAGTAITLLLTGTQSAGFELYNAGPQTVYVGGASVTTANGAPLTALAVKSLSPAPGEAVYAVADSAGTGIVRILGVG